MRCDKNTGFKSFNTQFKWTFLNIWTEEKCTENANIRTEEGPVRVSCKLPEFGNCAAAPLSDIDNDVPAFCLCYFSVVIGTILLHPRVQTLKQNKNVLTHLGLSHYIKENRIV